MQWRDGMLKSKKAPELIFMASTDRWLACNIVFSTWKLLSIFCETFEAPARLAAALPSWYSLNPLLCRLLQALPQELSSKPAWGLKKLLYRPSPQFWGQYNLNACISVNEIAYEAVLIYFRTLEDICTAVQGRICCAPESLNSFDDVLTMIHFSTRCCGLLSSFSGVLKLPLSWLNSAACPLQEAAHVAHFAQPTQTLPFEIHFANMIHKCYWLYQARTWLCCNNSEPAETCSNASAFAPKAQLPVLRFLQEGNYLDVQRRVCLEDSSRHAVSSIVCGMLFN